jgi:DNA-binding NarL/FixJ family response regulator
MAEPAAALRVVIASDNFVTREGLTCLLSGVPGIKVVGRVDSHPETLKAAQQYAPDVLVVGIHTPRLAAEASLAAARQLRVGHPAISVVVVAEAGDGYALELLRTGAAGVAYLLDDRLGDLQTLVDAIRSAHAGAALLDPSIVNALVRRRLPTSLDVLSLRELDVLAEMAKGHTNSEIAKNLSVSKKAVESHVSSIFRKLRTPGPERFERRVMAVLTYLHEYGELSHSALSRPDSGRPS